MTFNFFPIGSASSPLAKLPLPDIEKPKKINRLTVPTPEPFPTEILRAVQIGLRYLEVTEPDQLPIDLLSIIDEELWPTFNDHEGTAFPSFGAFAAAREPYGLSARRLERAMYLRTFLFHHHRLAEWVDVLSHITRRPGRPTTLAQGECFGPVYQLPTGSNAVDRILLRLKRQRPDLLERVVQRDISIQQAAAEAGWKKPKPQLQIDKTLIQPNCSTQPRPIEDLSEKEKSALICEVFHLLKPETRAALLVSLGHPH